MGSEYRQLILGDEFSDLFAEPEVVAEPLVDTYPLGESLIANMEAQLELYVSYVDQAKRQRLALVNRRLEENQQVNRETDYLLNRLATLEVERINLTEGILGKKTKDASHVKCEVLYPLLHAGQAKRLRACRDALIKTVEELKSTLTINAKLVENGSRIIHTTIGIMTSVVGRSKQDKMSTYTAKGSVNVGRVQIRNLFNRSV